MTRDKLEKNKKRRNIGDEGGEEKKSFPGNGRAKKPKTTESEEVSAAPITSFFPIQYI